MTVRLHIDRLVVDPDLGGDAHTLERDIGAALQVALATHQGWQPLVERRWQVDAQTVAPIGVPINAPSGGGTGSGTLGACIGSALHAAVTGSAGGPGGERR